MLCVDAVQCGTLTLWIENGTVGSDGRVYGGTIRCCFCGQRLYPALLSFQCLFHLKILEAKEQVARSFDKAATHYDDVASIQQVIACDLADLCHHPGPASILDIGSGTGYGIGLLAGKFRRANVVGLDISFEMAKYSNELCLRFPNKSGCICADAERMPFCDRSFDIIFSASAFQWLTDIEHVLQDCHRILSPNGKLIFSTFGKRTLHELEASWRAIDSHRHVLSFLSPDIIKSTLRKSSLILDTFSHQNYMCRYACVNDLLSSLRAMGATYSSKTIRGATTPAKLKAMAKIYKDRFADASLIPATFNALCFVASKPATEDENL